MCVNCDFDKLRMIKPLLFSIQFSTAFLNSWCFQYILRKKKLTFWEISIGVNFICFPGNDEKFDF